MPKPRNPKRKLIQQVCVIPYRRLEEGGDALEFCLITSLVKKRWIFPKGIVERDETAEEAARKEVWEEAGLRGNVVGEPLGQFDDQKWGCDLRVQVLMMDVAETAEAWPEVDQRQRQWMTVADARRCLTRTELKEFLVAACERLSCQPLRDAVRAGSPGRSAAADS